MSSCVIKGVNKGVSWMRACGASPRGMVLAPPLIGGHALMQLRMLRPLVRRSLDLISFNYAGHGDTAGRFTFQAALDNTLHILDLTREKCRLSAMPLFGLATCFAAIPMLHAIRQHPRPMAGLVLINAVPHLHGEKLVAGFLRFWQRNGAGWPTLGGVESALRAYRDDLFPHIARQGPGFGILAHHRTRWRRMVRDLVALRHINREPLAATPVLCVYGRHDRLLRQMGFADGAQYESLISRICPDTEFLPLDGDHFFAAAAIRRQLLDAVADFFRRKTHSV